MRHSVVKPALILALVLLVVSPRVARAATGETGFAFLKLGVGARAMGLGSAYVALADDPTALHWNPAGLAAIPGTQVTVMHNEWIQDFRQEFVAVGRIGGVVHATAADTGVTALKPGRRARRGNGRRLEQM